MGLIDTLQSGLQLGNTMPRRRLPQFTDPVDEGNGNEVNDEAMGNVAGPALTAPVEAPIDTSSQFPAVDHSRLDSLRQQQVQLNQPLSLKQKLIKAAILGAPMLAGAAFGGVEGAGAAGAGVSDVLGREEKQREFNNTNLQREEGDESRNVGLMERLRSSQVENANRDALADRRLQQQVKAEADRDALTRSHYGAEENHWKAEEGKPQPFSLDRELYNNLTASDPTAAATPEGRTGLLKQVQSDAHPYHPPPINFQIMPTATGDLGGVFNPRDPRKLLPPPDKSDAPDARKSQEPAMLQNREVQAKAIQASENKIMSDIDKNTGLLGPWHGRWTNIHAFIGDASPEAMNLKGELTAHWSLIPAMHGMRSNQMLQDLDKKYGNLKFEADSLKAAVRGVSSAAGYIGGAIKDTYHPGSGGDGGGEVEEWERGPDGKLRPKQ